MPTQTTIKRASRKAREGKKPSTQAGEFVHEEMKRYERGDPDIKSRKQAIAIGLSEARRAGVKLKSPKKGTASGATRKKAQRDKAVGQGKARPDPVRSRAAKKAAMTRKHKGR
ncbi:ku family containing domain-containing protein [Opitutaceae bacterium TAV5]|nr:ku family containing domain-containing protein [Opitutaceae bacterium TAV5]